uniref:Movement protein TGB2 n=1 Tax=Helleborus net necrosis virus TaxID=592206 RepID=B9UZ31_9VIRU|nr:triple gene block protein 2 [Helleborus net necrosis virus]ACM45993.1 triple gene block protein 2 [Helleborus net necrosis virus]
MPLSPPPDHSRSFLALAVGLTLAVCLFALTRSTLPHVGDNIHSLPHGGCYRDGTKQISYGKPAGRVPSSNLFSGFGFSTALFIAVVLAGLTIYKGRRTTVCHLCRCNH